MDEGTAREGGEVTRLLTMDEVATCLHVSKSQVKRWLKAKVIPGAVRLGPQTVRFDPEAIARWVRAGGMGGAGNAG